MKTFFQHVCLSWYYGIDGSVKKTSQWLILNRKFIHQMECYLQRRLVVISFRF